MKMNRKMLAAALSSYFSLGIGAPLPTLAGSLAVTGNLVEVPSLIVLLNQLAQATAAADQDNFQTSAAAAITLTSLQNLSQRLTNGGAVVVTLDSAYNIVNAINNPFLGQAFPFEISATGATTVAAPTLTGTGVTLAGTTTVLAAAKRWYQGLITQVVTTVGAQMTAGTTFTSLTQVGATNRYTVALATNAIVPVVGSAVFLGLPAGAVSLGGANPLPAGWYPIDQVTSAVSFVIVAPPSAVAWTATAATVPGTALVPVSQYTPGLLGIYSPLLTVTGKTATATAVITV